MFNEGNDYHFQGTFENGRMLQGNVFFNQESVNYEGFVSLETGKFDGKGLLISDDGMLDGFFKDGMLHGFAKIISKVEKGKQGIFKFGKLDGPGCEMEIHGGRYKGECLGGLPHGQGIIINNDSSIYNGMFKNGEPNGQGRLDFPNGNSHEGQFKGTLLNGQGIKIIKNKKVIMKGTFVEGSMYGKGSLTIYKDEQLKEIEQLTIGEFYDSKPHGKVRIERS